MRTKRLSGIAIVIGAVLGAVPVVAGIVNAPAAVADDVVTDIREANSGDAGREASLEGFVTAVADQGSFYVQTQGTGGKVPQGGASEAILVIGASHVPDVGRYVSLRGTTEDTGGTRAVRVENPEERDAPEGASVPVAVTEIEGIAPAEMLWSDEYLFRLRGMLIRPSGDWTVTGVDRAATRGEIAIVAGTTPFGADAGHPDAVAKIALDDGLTIDYLSEEGDRRSPWTGGDAPRAGDRVEFRSDLVLQVAQGVGGVSDGWRLQPLSSFDATTVVEERPYVLHGDVPLSAPQLSGGDLNIATVDLGNYFPVEGALVSPAGTSCKAVPARNGQAVAVTGEGGCYQLGAASQATFEVQREKVHALLRGLSDVDVIAIQGVANPLITPAAEGEYERLADVLTVHSGVAWQAVTASTDTSGPWTTGFLYRADRVETQGGPVALQDPVFERSATPLVQAFAPKGREAVALVSVRLSTQSESDYSGDRQARRFAGTNAPERTAQVEALQRQLETATLPDRTVVLGAFGSLTRDPVLNPLTQSGARDVVGTAGLTTSRDGDGAGALVHAFVPPALAGGHVTTWAINAPSATTAGFAFEGSLAASPVDPSSAERSSADDPVLLALPLAERTEQTKNPVVAAAGAAPQATSTPGGGKPEQSSPAGTGSPGSVGAPSVDAGSTPGTQGPTDVQAAPDPDAATVDAPTAEVPVPSASEDVAQSDSQLMTMPNDRQLAVTGSGSPAAMVVAIVIGVLVVLGASVTAIGGRARRT